MPREASPRVAASNRSPLRCWPRIPGVQHGLGRMLAGVHSHVRKRNLLDRRGLQARCLTGLADHCEAPGQRASTVLQVTQQRSLLLGKGVEPGFNRQHVPLQGSTAVRRQQQARREILDAVCLLRRCADNHMRVGATDAETADPGQTPTPSGQGPEVVGM